jgi:transcriptional regulator with XRE-family HTH domain
MPKPSEQPRSEAAAEFGRRVRDLRQKQELSQETLGARSGVHWTFIGHVERGQRSIRLENILKIAHGLGVAPGDLLDGISVDDHDVAPAGPISRRSRLGN